MLRTRQALFEDFLYLDMDKATSKQLGSGPVGVGPIDNCTTCYWREFNNVQAIYGIIWDGKRAELAMAISEWVRMTLPMRMARLAKVEVPRLIADVGHDEIWARAPDGFDYIPRWFAFLGFKPTGLRSEDNESDLYKWAP